MERRAFTLIELLVVIAIVAILAAILFPVFAQAKKSAKITSSLSGVKQIATGLQLYSGDADDVAVPDYGYATQAEPSLYRNRNTWVGRTFPYVKSRSLYFDKTVADPSGELFPDRYYPAYTYTWEWITNFSLNVDGYSQSFGGSGCTAIDYSRANARSLTAFEDPAQRLAVTPVRYGTLNYGWMRFYGLDAAWPTSDRYVDGFSWNNLVWDARKDYTGPRFIGAFADGHAARFGREKFVGYYVDTPAQTEASTFSQFCARMDDKRLWPFWGRAWSGE